MISGTPTQDFGTVPTSTLVSDNLDIDVSHNMDPSQTFSLGARVDKILGPTWAYNVRIHDGVDGRNWNEDTFGYNQYFTSDFGGSSQSFTVPVLVTFDVASDQTFGTFQFEIEMIVSSL